MRYYTTIPVIKRPQITFLDIFSKYKKDWNIVQKITTNNFLSSNRLFFKKILGGYPIRKFFPGSKNYRNKLNGIDTNFPPSDSPIGSIGSEKNTMIYKNLWIWVVLSITPDKKFFSFLIIVELFYAQKTFLGFRLEELSAFLKFFCKIKLNKKKESISPELLLQGEEKILMLGGHPFLFSENLSKISSKNSKLYKKNKIFLSLKA